MIGEIILLILSYLLGSFPYMLILSRAKGFDFTCEPDYHIAMYRKVGRMEGISGIFVDVMKGVIPVLAGFLLNFDILVVSLAAVFAVAGQMWPVFQKFNGEKGNTIGLGAILTLTLCYNSVWIFLWGALPMLIGFLIRTLPRFFAPGQTSKERFGFGGPVSNSLPLGMIIGFGVFPLASWLMGYPWQITIALLLIFIGIVIRRLTASVRKDVAEGKSSKCRILLNRLLYDRSFYQV